MRKCKDCKWSFGQSSCRRDEVYNPYMCCEDGLDGREANERGSCGYFVIVWYKRWMWWLK